MGISKVVQRAGAWELFLNFCTEMKKLVISTNVDMKHINQNAYGSYQPMLISEVLRNCDMKDINQS